jgi:curved DNA-binding protein
MNGAEGTTMSMRRAREVLRTSMYASPGELRRAFRDAAKLAHPDRAGGSAEHFREVVEAYRLLQLVPTADRIIQPPARMEPSFVLDTLELSPLTAMSGGVVDHRPSHGPRLKLTLPPGMRNGDMVRAAGIELEVVIRGGPEMLVRGDDLWMTVRLDPSLLARGGRIGLETPLGRRVIWVTKKAGSRGLVRLPGQGLPARGRHRQGHLFLRLTPHVGAADSAARTLRRRFAAAWAA